MVTEIDEMRRQMAILEKRDETNLAVIRSLRCENKALRDQLRCLLIEKDNMDSEGD